MQRNNINLYQHFKKAEKVDKNYLSWHRYVFANGIIILILAAFYIVDILNVKIMRDNYAKALVDLAHLKIQFYDMKKSYPQLFFSADVGGSITNLQKNIQKEKEILEAIANERHFSNLLLATARAIAPNVWLTQIQISKNGDIVQFKGKSLNNQSLQMFLQQLIADKVFLPYQATLTNVAAVGKPGESTLLNFDITMTERNT